MSTQLSKNFTLEELLVSSSAKKYGIDNTPNSVSKANLTMLCTKLLQPIRDKYGKAIVVTSGYRCPALNAKIGGASTSQHVKGQAADINDCAGYKAGGKERYKANGVLFNLIRKMGGYDQLINEYPDTDGNPQWIHVSYNPSQKYQRNQTLIAKKVGGKTVYVTYRGQDGYKR